MEPSTDRELIIQVDAKMDNLAANVGRLADVVERLENSKFAGVEKRVSDLEKFKNQWLGASVLFNVLLAIIAIYAGFRK